jgi:ABC-type multidrug transport system fused ATPase/permease subunit
MGLAVGLFLLQIIASLGIHHCFYRSASTGVLLRGGLITAIYNRALRLTSRARGTMTNGRLVNHISTDISRIDFCCQFFHMGWTAPIQMIICLILLILQIGPSALAGFAFFILASPVLTVVMKKLIIVRKKSMAWTDKRAKLIQELLGGMRIMKFFAWEVSLHRLHLIRLVF